MVVQNLDFTLIMIAAARVSTVIAPRSGTLQMDLTASVPLLLWWEFSFYLGFKSS